MCKIIGAIEIERCYIQRLISFWNNTFAEEFSGYIQFDRDKLIINGIINIPEEVVNDLMLAWCDAFNASFLAYTCEIDMESDI